jgi:glutathione synthase/RimK-type ligase-like ATP-grasp enzyme
MAVHIVLVEHRRDWLAQFPSAMVVTAQDYLGTAEYQKLKDVRVLNLCRGYRYLSLGYYCSLLAEARRHRVIPAVRTITDLFSKAIYSLGVEDLDSVVQRSLGRHLKPAEGSRFELDIYFGRCGEPALQDLAEEIFDLYPCPLLRVEFRHQGKWNLAALRPLALGAITPEDHERFVAALDSYLSRRWRTPRVRDVTRYDLAILHNPTEALPPTNARGLRKFVQAGRKLKLSVDLITKKDYGQLAEYDALFIRETTNIDHHTYRFAKKAEAEGMVVLDDPDSIVRCTNKVYLAELLQANRIPTPRTLILQNGEAQLGRLDELMPFPVVVKIPDGSFSRGVHKAENPRELDQHARALLRESDLILLQEYVYTEFDWRVGVLNRQAVFVCQYFMSRKHWQIVRHAASGQFTQGVSRTIPVDEAPREVVRTALAAANLIGDGFYGVDLKQVGDRVVVMEVNDNPNVDPGVEDAVLGDRLYGLILEEFVRRLDAQTRAG